MAVGDFAVSRDRRLQFGDRISVDLVSFAVPVKDTAGGFEVPNKVASFYTRTVVTDGGTTAPVATRLRNIEGSDF